MTKQLERNARGGDLLSAFTLYQAHSQIGDTLHPIESDKWFEYCWNYLQHYQINVNKITTPKNKFYLRSLTMTDFRRFSQLDVRFENDLTVIIGGNGQGKTSIITAIAKTLSWFTANILKEDSVGQRLSELTDIKNDSKLNYCDVTSNFSFGKGLKNISVRLSRSALGMPTRRESIVKDAKYISDIWRIVNAKKTVNLPIFALYSIERSHPFVKPIKDNSELREGRFDAYTNILSGAGRFDHFIEWFIALHKRTADDASTSIDILKQQVNDLQKSIDAGLVSVIPLLENAKTQLNNALLKVSCNQDGDSLSAPSQKRLIIDAISRSIPSISNIWVETSSGFDVVKLTNDGHNVTVEQLSDGQRIFLSLVADLARRMIMLNPLLDNPFEGSGIVLIDEIELHLHPQWQQDIIENLRSLFPNIQFIITTHSPIVLSTVDKRCIRQFENEDGGDSISLSSPTFQTKGVINSDILEQIMRVFATPPKIAESHWISDFEESLEIVIYEKNSKAKELYEKIKNHFGENSNEIKRCDSLIRIKNLKLKMLNKNKDKGL
jgi:predicted ATP-binding protein involved in virulence